MVLRKLSPQPLFFFGTFHHRRASSGSCHSTSQLSDLRPQHIINMSTAVEEKASPKPIDTAKSDNSAFSEEVPPTPNNVDIETTEKNDGLYFVKEQGPGAAGGLKLAKDGRTVLIPQPSDNDEDPLNWSWLKKHKALFALLLPSLLTDWGMTWGTTLFEAQAMTWHMSIPDAARSVSGGIFLQGPGGVLAVPLVQRYGRYVIQSASLNRTKCSPDCLCFSGPRFWGSSWLSLQPSPRRMLASLLSVHFKDSSPPHPKLLVSRLSTISSSSMVGNATQFHEQWDNEFRTRKEGEHLGIHVLAWSLPRSIHLLFPSI
jgi:hypothetical protein